VSSGSGCRYISWGYSLTHTHMSMRLCTITVHIPSTTLSYSLPHSLTHTFTYAHIHLLTHSLTHIFTYSHIHLLTYSLTPSLPFPHFLTHSLTLIWPHLFRSTKPFPSRRLLLATLTPSLTHSLTPSLPLSFALAMYALPLPLCEQSSKCE
jgi:hypothetical protein